MADDTTSRRESIRALIRTREIGTQEELRELLAKDGYDVTQATLSRDLAKLGARRVSRPSGGSAYELPEAPVSTGPGEEKLAEMGPMVVAINDNGTLVVIHTTPGTASAVALAIDAARLPEVLGTLAGDDAIFVAPAKNHAAGKLSNKFKKLFKKGTI